MKQWLTVIIVLTIALALFTPALQIAVFMFVFYDSCDDITPTPVSNARGDVAEEELQICSGIGTDFDYSISLKPQGAKAARTIVQFSPSTDVSHDRILRWIGDDTLNVDLGKVRAVWGKVWRVGSIRISYTYSHSFFE